MSGWTDGWMVDEWMDLLLERYILIMFHTKRKYRKQTA
jgi:hypothetical protein